MKKRILLCINGFLICFILSISKTFAYTDEFLLLLETMDIPMENIIGKSINEDIYNEYKLIVYGNPLDNHNGQRWKNVTTGKWTKNGGAWRGNGTRGEYWILGTNYNGKEVHNHLFPVDIEPPTEPTSWRYAIIPDALESWQETDKYMDDIQREYMLTQKLMRNNITYDLKVGDIGFDKVRIENYATWKTKGTVYTQRYDMNNKKWAANFMIQPMAGDAELDGYAEFPQGTEYQLTVEDGDLIIPITYGSKVINLTDYAKKEHVKEIKSELYINGKYIEEIKDRQNLSVNKEAVFKVNKNDYTQNSLIVLDVQIKSTLFTTFITDGPLLDVKKYTIYIEYGEVEDELIESEKNFVSNENKIVNDKLPYPQITSIEITRIENGKEKPLLISKKTGKEFICAGQTIKVKAKIINYPWTITFDIDGDTSIKTFDELTKLFEWTEPRARNEKTLFESLKLYQNMYKEKVITNIGSDKIEEEFEFIYIVPYKTKQTLHSWSSLREISNNAFGIDEKKLFTRIDYPYEIVIKAKGINGITTKRVELDVFERWDTLYNRDLSSYIKQIE